MPIYQGVIVPETDHGLYVHARCHPEAATWAFVTEEAVRIECAECQREVVTLALYQADDEEPEEDPAEAWKR